MSGIVFKIPSSFETFRLPTDVQTRNGILLCNFPSTAYFLARVNWQPHCEDPKYIPGLMSQYSDGEIKDISA